MTKSELDCFFTENYDNVFVAAKNIVRKNSKNQDEDAQDLVSSLAEYLYSREDVYSKLDPGVWGGQSKGKYCICKFVLVWMKQQYNWEKTPYKLTHHLNSNVQLSDDMSKYDGEYSHHDMETETEAYTEEYKEMYSDFINNYSDSQTDKIIFTYQYINKQSPWLKSLFDMHINKRMSIAKIAKQVGLPDAAVYQMLNELKEDIRSRYNKNNKIQL
jgi:hypothetical protein